MGLELNDREDLLLAHLDLVRKWNPKIRLIGPAQPGEEVVLHVLDSLAVLPLIPFPVARHLDVGSGAGFPGVPLNILLEGTTTTLAEKLEKKGAFLKECTRRLDLDRLKVVVRKISRTGLWKEESFDLITFRAVAPIRDIVPDLEPHLSKDGWIMAYKGPGVDQELTEAAGTLRELGLGVVSRRDFLLPFLAHSRSLVALGRV